jgi:hypothetical protein
LRRPAGRRGASTSRCPLTFLEPGRVNVFERWDSDEDLQRFRGAGPDGGQLAALLSIDVGEYAVAEGAE